MQFGASSTVLDVALTLLLALVGVATLKLVCHRWRHKREGSDSDGSDDSEDDSDGVLSTAEAMGVDSDTSEKVALITQERRRMQRAATHRPTSVPPLASLRALLPGAVVERKLLPSSHCKLRAPKRFHKPHFHPLLDETAQWWEAQQQTLLAPETPASATTALSQLHRADSGDRRSRTETDAIRDTAVAASPLCVVVE